MHELLREQLRSIYGSEEAVPKELTPLLELVDESYRTCDEDRHALERSLDLSAREYIDSSSSLEADRDEQAGKYRRLFEDSREAIYISTPDGRLLDINPAGVDLFGFSSKEEMLNLDLREVLYADPATREPVLQELARNGFVKDAELELRRKDGSSITVLESSTTDRDESGRIVSYRGILKDMTRQRELEREVRHAQKMEAVGSLAGGIAHDFNNLLSVIIGYSDLLSRNVQPGSVMKTQVEAIGMAAERGASLTRKLLAMGRKQVLIPKHINLNMIVCDMDRLLHRLLGDGVNLEIDLDPELGSIKADPGQIEHVILNLVVNARDAMPDGGRIMLSTSGIDLSAERAMAIPGMEAGRCVRLRVIDTGQGIDREVIDRIFDPFFTTKEKGKGSGLGLAIAAGIVNQSGGNISVRNRDGGGSVFELLFPCCESVTEEKPIPAGKVAATGGSETILLAEDESSVRSLLTQYLESLGYAVTGAVDGADALRKAATMERIDLLVTDMVMPRVSGIELAEELQRMRPGLRTLLITGYTDNLDAIVQNQALAGRIWFLQKPFANDLFGGEIRSILDLDIEHAKGA